MGIFSEISKIEKLRDARMEAGRSGEAQPGGVKPWVRGGFWLICGLAACSLVLLRLFSNGSMPPNWAFSVGVESFSIMVSAIIYYSYMQDPDSSEAHTALFAQLLVADTVGLFLDEVAWLVQGRAGLAAVNVIANALLFLDRGCQ